MVMLETIQIHYLIIIEIEMFQFGVREKLIVDLLPPAYIFDSI